MATYNPGSMNVPLAEDESMSGSPVIGPAVWTGRELQVADYAITLGPEQRESLINAVTALPELDCTEPLDVPELAKDLHRVEQQLEDGRGFVLLRGLPVDRLTYQQSRNMLLGLAACLGRPILQSIDRGLLVDVRDAGFGQSRPNMKVRGFQTAQALDYHTDGGDIVGLVCLTNKAIGGTSLIVSAAYIYNAVLDRAPELAELLFERWYFDRRGFQGEGEMPYFRSPLAARCDGKFSFKHTPRFIYSAARHDDVPELTIERIELLRMIESEASREGVALHMEFAPGDLQLLNNYAVLHGRTAYQDSSAGQRHLLRVWLTARRRRVLPAHFIDF